jgi:molecular chaperone DnaK
VSFDIDANGLLQVSATDRTTGRQQSVTIQGGSNLSEEEITQLLQEAEQKATEDRRKRAEVDRSNRAQTLVAQAERRLRDASLELGPYGAERQQRAVEMAVREVQDLLALNSKAENDLADLDMAVSQLQEALFGLNRRLMTERRSEQGPLQGLKNTLGSLKDELFADDDWDDWNRPGNDPWSMPPSRFGGEFGRRNSYDNPRYDRTPGFDRSMDRPSQGWQAAPDQWREPAPNQWAESAPSQWSDQQASSDERPRPVARAASAFARLR